MFLPRPYQAPNYSFVLMLAASNTLRTNAEYSKFIMSDSENFRLFGDGGDVIHNPMDVFTPSLPEHFIVGSSFVALCTDTDCDGTAGYARRVDAPTLAHARLAALDIDGCHDVVTHSEMREGSEGTSWNPDFFAETGYCSLYFNANPWVEDDTLGTPLDHSYDYELSA